jgi:hypothetical protein
MGVSLKKHDGKQAFQVSGCFIENTLYAIMNSQRL